MESEWRRKLVREVHGKLTQHKLYQEQVSLVAHQCLPFHLSALYLVKWSALVAAQERLLSHWLVRLPPLAAGPD